MDITEKNDVGSNECLLSFDFIFLILRNIECS